MCAPKTKASADLAIGTSEVSASASARRSRAPACSRRVALGGNGIPRSRAASTSSAQPPSTRCAALPRVRRRERRRALRMRRARYAARASPTGGPRYPTVKRSQAGHVLGSRNERLAPWDRFWVAFCAWSGPCRMLGGLFAAGGGTIAPVFFSSERSCCWSGALVRSGTNWSGRIACQPPSRRATSTHACTSLPRTTPVASGIAPSTTRAGTPSRVATRASVAAYCSSSPAS